MDRIPSDAAGYCVCNDEEYRIVRCHDIPSTCETLCLKEQVAAPVNEVALHRENLAEGKSEEPPLGAMHVFGIAVIGLFVVYLLSSQRDEKTTGDRLDDFMKRRYREELQEEQQSATSSKPQ